MLFLLILCGVISTLACGVLVRSGRRSAERYALDVPQRFHAGHVPRLGGIAMMAACSIGWFWMVVAERYPELRATQGFRDLQAQLEGTENRIAVERRTFNEAVQRYNTAVKRFPAVLLAGIMGFQPRPYFQSAAGAETPPKVQFEFGTPTNK